MSDEARANSDKIKDGLLFLAGAAERLDRQDFGSLRRQFLANPRKAVEDMQAVSKFIKNVKQQVYDLMPSNPQRIEAPKGTGWHPPDEDEDDDE